MLIKILLLLLISSFFITMLASELLNHAISYFTAILISLTGFIQIIIISYCIAEEWKAIHKRDTQFHKHLRSLEPF